MIARVVHYDHPDLWNVNICGVRGTWAATGDPKKVTCKRCRRHLTYWVAEDARGAMLSNLKRAAKAKR